jgi:hypothetical protein
MVSFIWLRPRRSEINEPQVHILNGSTSQSVRNTLAGGRRPRTADLDETCV